ncbi:MAG: hypothetical protein U5Q44_14245 [Dehalococcoidia bacterium]|nr:hypothetical protein [Dehalococcoidia bacterium]
MSNGGASSQSEETTSRCGNAPACRCRAKRVAAAVAVGAAMQVGLSLAGKYLAAQAGKQAAKGLLSSGKPDLRREQRADAAAAAGRCWRGDRDAYRAARVVSAGTIGAPFARDS